MDSGCILKVAPRAFADSLDVERERKERAEGDAQISGPSGRKDAGAAD